MKLTAAKDWSGTVIVFLKLVVIPVKALLTPDGNEFDAT